jgi:hypothetical protein
MSDETRFTLTPVTTFKEANIATGAVAEAVLNDVLTTNLPANVSESLATQGFFELSK